MYDSIGELLSNLPLWTLLVAMTLLGAIWGSFVAALCSRWPKGESITTGRSRCDACDQQIASYDLIPVASYLLLNGKCRNCASSIGMLPFVTELAAAFIGVVPVLVLPASQAVAAGIFGWLLLPLIILDHRHLWLPNLLVVLLAAIGLIAAPMLTPDLIWSDRLVGLSVGFLSLAIIRQAYKKYRQVDGMGAGDPKLFGAIGIWLGWQVLPVTLLIASVIGLVFALMLHLMGRASQAAFPFGSYLGIAAYICALVT